MANANTDRRKGSDRRLTFTQTPYTAEFSEKLANAADMTKADLYNTAMQILSLMVGVYSSAGTEYVIRDENAELYREDPALKVLLGDILSSLRQREGTSPHELV
ncbi:hypothetical protein AB0H76_26255 [Nocardia sp. NPDC050712]|uniref:hypothetical protein n=1 Tax=Nocardia sp. NPDC050712 TaxID=3155518 RepID=UPI0033D7F692